MVDCSFLILPNRAMLRPPGSTTHPSQVRHRFVSRLGSVSAPENPFPFFRLPSDSRPLPPPHNRLVSGSSPGVPTILVTKANDYIHGSWLLNPSVAALPAHGSSDASVFITTTNQPAKHSFGLPKWEMSSM
jgi:hypothetical protein